jgi:hypothetical protein
MSDRRDRLAERLREAGLSTARFIDVVDGEKKSVDHEQHEPEGVTGNYGIYATGADALVVLDIDDYGDLDDKSGYSALSRLPPTLEQGSPHGGTHRFYAISPTDDGSLVAKALEDAFGKPNLAASWGEVRTKNQYVVGAGSQLDGCGKEWCDECEKDDGGHYVLQSDTELATIDAEDLIDVLSSDPELDRVPDEQEKLPEQPRTRTADDSDVSVYDVISSAYAEEERHAHPVHGSTTGSNFQVDDGAETWRCWRHSCTGNALHLLGMEEGIIDCGEWDGTGLSSETWAEIFEAARERGLDVGDPPETVDSTSDFTNLDEDEVERGEAILQSQCAPDEPVGDLEYHNGGYGLPWENRDENGDITSSGYDMVTNFTLETLSFLETEERRSDEFVVRVHPNHPTEEPYDVRVAPSVFNSGEKFRDEIVLGRTTWFDPSNRKGIRTVTLLRHLRETVGAQPAPHRTGQPYVGLSGDYDEFVTPNGSMTADGWAEDPDFEFYSKGGAADSKGAFGDKWVLDPEEDPDVKDENVARICELLWQTRKAERGLPMLGWFYVAPIKALIHDWEGEFPLLSPHGDTGTGKTATIETFCRAFGLTGEPLSATDTRFTIQKHISESRGAPVWFDEYKPTEMGESQLDHLHQRLKEVTKERTMSKGRPDLDMVQLHLRAPVVLSGEQKVADPAVRRRTILTNLSREPTRDGTPTKAAFGELTGTAYEDADGNQHYPEGYDLDEHSRRFYQWVLDYGPEKLRSKWNTAREKVKQLLEQFGVTVEASEERGLQTIIFGVALYKSFAKDVGADPEKLPGDSHIREACRHVIDNIGKGGQRREHTDEFLEVCSLAASDGYLEPGIHHRLLDSQNHECEVLALHMPTVFSTVKKFVRDTNLENEYSILSKTDYLNSFRNKADANGTEVLETNKRTRGIENGSKAVHFDHSAITDKLGADFNVDAFRPLSERETGDMDDVTPIASLTTSGNPYTDLTVRVNSWDAGPDGGPAESGVVEDATGTVDVVDFFGTNEASKLEEDECFRLENARVGTYDDAIQIEIVQNTTTVTPIQAGSGTTSSPDPDSGADDASQSSLEAAADGGTASAEDQKPTDKTILQWVDEHAGEQGAPFEKVVPSVAGDVGVEPGYVEERIEALKQRGEIYEPAEGHLRRS